MNLALPSGPLTQAIGWALLHLIWQGALIAACLAIVLRLLTGGSASLRYFVSCAALGLLVILGVASGVRSFRAAEAPVSAAPTQLGSPLIQHSPTFPVAALAQPDRLRSLAHAANDVLPVIVAVWFAGVAMFSLRLLLEWLRAHLLVNRHASRAREQWQASVRRLSGALGVRRAVRVLESSAIDVPSVMGLLRPVILLPASALSGLAPSQLEMILAHELAHIRRHDFLINLLQAVVETVLFYHPAVWWISRQIRVEREDCCDDLAVAVCGNRLRYARTLLKLEELRASAMPLTLSANGGSLFQRIRRIAVGTKATTGPAIRLAGALAVLSFVMLAITLPWSPALGRSNTREKHVRPTVQRRPSIQAVVVPSLPGPIPLVIAPGPAPRDDNAVELAQDQPAPEASPASEDASEVTLDNVSIDDLIALRAVGVTAADIRELRTLFPQISLKQITAMKAVGATPKFVERMRDAGLDVGTPEDAQGLAAVGVTPLFLREMRSLGFEALSAHEAQGLAAVGVTTKFVLEMRAAGLPVRAASEAQGLAAVGVTLDFLRGMRTLGIVIESVDQAQGLAAVGVTPDYVREMRDAGVELEGAADAKSLCAVGVTPEFVRKLGRAGYKNLSAQDLSRLAASGVTGRFIQEMSQYRTR